MWDFEHLHIEFEWQGKMKLFKGIPPCRLKVRKKLPSSKMMHTSAQLYLISITEPECTPKNKNLLSYPELQALRDKYQSLFSEPTTLPSIRPDFDHRIQLQPNTPPIDIRPYTGEVLSMSNMFDRTGPQKIGGLNIKLHSIC